MSDIANKVADTVETIADEFAEIRDLLNNANKPVLEALGKLASMVEGMRADLQAHQDSTNEQISRLRKKAGNGPTPAE